MICSTGLLYDLTHLMYEVIFIFQLILLTGTVNSLLTWSSFLVLGRLTYTAYLIHPSFIYTYYGKLDQLFYNYTLNVVSTCALSLSHPSVIYTYYGNMDQLFL